MGDYIAGGMIVMFFVFSLLIDKIKSWRYIPVLYSILTVFFIVIAATDRDRLFAAILFALISLSLTVRSVRMIRESGKSEKE